MALDHRLGRLEQQAERSRLDLPSTTEQRAQLLRPYLYDPVAFLHDCVTWPEGEGPTSYQEETLDDLVHHHRVAERGPHGLGKTSTAAWAVLWFAETRDALGIDWKCPTTASAWRQLTKFLWPEVRKWTRRLRWDRLGREPYDRRRELLDLSLKLNHGEAFAVASDEPSLIEGAHAVSLLYVFDEAKAIPPGTFDAAEGAFSNAGGDTGSEAFALAFSTPGEPNGRFFEIHARRPGLEDWHARHITLEEAIRAGRLSREWAEQRKLQWGEESAVYQNRVLGEFAASDEDGVIPLSWIEAANERWRELETSGLRTSFVCVGVDVARSGSDKTVQALRVAVAEPETEDPEAPPLPCKEAIAELRRTTREDTMETAGRVAGVLNAYGGFAVVDVIGLGAGVVDRLREQGHKIIAFNASEGTGRRDRSGELGYANVRSAAWWSMREILDPQSGEDIALPPDDRLTGDLTAPHWRVTSGGKIQIESKDDIGKRLGRSTDDGDAVVQAFWQSGATAQPLLVAGTSRWNPTPLGGAPREADPEQLGSGPLLGRGVTRFQRGRWGR